MIISTAHTLWMTESSNRISGRPSCGDGAHSVCALFGRAVRCFWC
ncbi:MAG: hypothetical protein FLDDKLPJ_03336 [Phycisphaerae bacterium]|nr:hypothetical protein [Phycisphaerae bacterium]